jgi:hypothetical protein
MWVRDPVICKNLICGSVTCELNFCKRRFMALWPYELKIYVLTQLE